MLFSDIFYSSPKIENGFLALLHFATQGLWHISSAEKLIAINILTEIFLKD